jgi:cell division protease FtsH
MDPKQRQFSIWYMFIALWVLILIQTFLPALFNPTDIPLQRVQKRRGGGQGH